MANPVQARVHTCGNRARITTSKADPPVGSQPLVAIQAKTASDSTEGAIHYGIQSESTGAE
jgi:hypothetical protein